MWVWLLGVVLWSLLEVNLYSLSVLGPRLVAVVESSEVVASRRYLLHCFKGSSVGGRQVGRSREVGRFSEGSLREVSLYCAWGVAKWATPTVSITQDRFCIALYVWCKYYCLLSEV